MVINANPGKLRSGPLPRGSERPEQPPDLQTQLEDVFVEVSRCERWARTEDRIDRAVRWSRG